MNERGIRLKDLLQDEQTGQEFECVSEREDKSCIEMLSQLKKVLMLQELETEGGKIRNRRSDMSMEVKLPNFFRTL